MKRLASMLAVPALAAALCAPLAAQDAPPAEQAAPGAAQAREAAPPDAMAGMQAVAAAPEAVTVSPDTAEPPKPAVKAPAAAKAPVPELELDFIKSAAADKDEDVQAMALQQAEDWLRSFPALPRSGEAQLLKADLHYKLGDYKAALTDLLRHFYEYPQAPSSADARKLFDEIMKKKADKAMKPGLQNMADSVGTGDAADRLFGMLQKYPAAAGALLYVPMTAECRDFLARFPEREGNDAVQMLIADQHLNMKEYLSARVAYERMIAVYPASPLIPRAKLLLAAMLADMLKDYDRSIQVFLDIIDTLPGTEQAWAAYHRLPELAEKRDRFQLAVDTYERIIRLYPDKEEAYSAFKAEARVLREEMDRYADAVAVLNRTADKYKDQRGVEALVLAAEIYRKDLKDTAGEIKTYDRIAADFPKDPQAPKALLAAGEVYEKAKDLDNARKYYEQVTQKYAEDAAAKKAQKRLDGLLAR